MGIAPERILLEDQSASTEENLAFSAALLREKGLSTDVAIASDNFHQRRAAEDRDIVAEGRDIGTVVFPNAQVKVFLTADPRERARRRVLQRHQNDAQPLTSEQLEAEVDETLDALKQRDKLDSSREVAPLVPAEDAVHVDSTAHTIDEVVSIIEDLINQRR